MNLTIKALEKIGQNTSIKQYESLSDMLKKMGTNPDTYNDLSSSELICIHFDDDDDDGDE